MDPLTPEQLDALCTKLGLDPATAAPDALAAAALGPTQRLPAPKTADTVTRMAWLIVSSVAAECGVAARPLTGACAGCWGA